MRNLSCDVLILGGGPAAMTAAIAAMDSGADALLVCKQSPGSSGNIVMARAGHSANFAPDDSAALFLEDTLEGGAHLNHPGCRRRHVRGFRRADSRPLRLGNPFHHARGRLVRLTPPGRPQEGPRHLPAQELGRGGGEAAAQETGRRRRPDSGKRHGRGFTRGGGGVPGRGRLSYEKRRDLRRIRLRHHIGHGRGGPDLCGEHERGRHHGRRLRGGAEGGSRAFGHGIRPVLPGRHQAAREQYGGGAHAVPAGRAGS